MTKTFLTLLGVVALLALSIANEDLFVQPIQENGDVQMDKSPTPGCIKYYNNNCVGKSLFSSFVKIITFVISLSDELISIQAAELLFLQTN